MTQQKEIKTVLSSKLSGGPHGLGDPDDKSLRTSEIKVLIPQIIRERARKFKCVPEVEKFAECCKKEGFLMTFRCKPQTNDYKECMARWFYDEQFNEECKQIYLDQRSEYRRTGISKKKRQFAGNSTTTEPNKL